MNQGESPAGESGRRIGKNSEKIQVYTDENGEGVMRSWKIKREN
jgi:hypothetical protein